MMIANLAWPAENPMLRATRLETLFIDANDGFSNTRYQLESGIYYRLRLQGDGRDEYTIRFGEFLDNVWLERIKIEDVEFAVSNLAELTLAGESEVDLYFVPIRPGHYPIGVKQMFSVGFEGEIVIR
jgi:hypothetical protein